MNYSRLRIGLYLFFVFTSGAVVGAVAHRLYSASAVSANRPRNPDEYRKRYMDEMQKRLQLTSDQATELNGILDSTRNKMREFREKHKGEFDAIQQEQTDRINQILTATQRAEYEAMRKDREKHQQRERGGESPGKR